MKTLTQKHKNTETQNNSQTKLSLGDTSDVEETLKRK